ncbi:asparagine synthase-related protein [Streptomyces sp. ZYX-F-203]
MTDQAALPAAYGFLAFAHTGAGQAPRATFATRGHQTAARRRLRERTLDTILVRPDRTAAGATAGDADTAVVLAGELYNRDEIASAVACDAASSDAELLLALVDRYGLHAFRLVNGRFAAAVLTGGTVLLATDHAGSVPLYTRHLPDGVLAATEAKALADNPAGSLGHPVSGARRVRRLPGLYQVPAGTVLEFDLDGSAATAHRTWQPPAARRILGEDHAVEEVRRVLARAVERRLPGGRPLVVLSGGIDSSAVAALADRSRPGIDTLSMGTDTADEFPQARIVAEHLSSDHREVTIPTADLLAQLPHTVHAAETLDPDIVEYLLPLTALYRRLDGPARRVLTGYGADIPLGGMHREDRLPNLDTVVAHDMDTFDGLNEMSPVLSTLSGHWSTHPYWDRDVLDCLTGLEAGLKRRHGRDKWVLRAAMGDLLPSTTVNRPKLGVHEGSGTTSSFSLLLTDAGVPEERLPAAKARFVRYLFDRVVVGGVHPDDVPVGDAVSHVVEETPT